MGILDPSKRNLGIFLALATAIISGISVFINGVAVTYSDPFIYTTLKNIGCLVFLGVAVLAFRERRLFATLSKKQWLTLGLIGLIGGSVPFLMFFWGLKLGGAAVSSFIYRSLFLFAGVFGYFVLKEKPTIKEFAAGILILFGNILLLPGELVFGFGQLLVLCATGFWALEYTISRKLLAYTSAGETPIHPRLIMVSRMLFGSAILLAFLGISGGLDSFVSAFSNPTLMGWLFVTSILLTGFVWTWYNSLYYLPVFKATSILALGGLITAILNLAFLGKAFSLVDALSMVLILIGVALMVGLSNLVRMVSGSKNPGPNSSQSQDQNGKSTRDFSARDELD